LGSSRAIRTAAWAVVAAGVAAPLLRRRLRVSAPVVAATTAAAPFGLCVARPRTPARDVVTVCLQMWAYLAAYQMPNDDPERLRERVRVDYPVAIDRVLGAGTIPTVRLQRLLARRGRISAFDKPLIWAHWLWFITPHAAIAYILAFRRGRFERSAAHMYSVFDLGLIVYWALPTAPPWYAAEQGRLGGEHPDELRRMMYEYGEEFWKEGWKPLYSVLGGNPLAAMPSLHFATSVMGARLLSDAGRVEGAVGWTYAAMLGLALVYLGEHYLIDLLAGLALTEGVRRCAPQAAPVFAAVSRAVQALETKAR
jgi:membrane-associated phospholipid phosphatase